MILVSILGDFHSSILPISYAFSAQISRHIIVYDDAKCDTQEAERLLHGQRAFAEQLPPNSPQRYTIETIRIDEDSYESILGCLEQIKLRAPNPQDIYLNTTDGLSSIAIVLSRQLLDIGARVIAYDRYDNTYNLHTSRSMQKHRIKHSMDIQSHLILKGYIILETADKAALQSRKEDIYTLTKDLQRYKQFAAEVQTKGINEISGYKDYREILYRIGITDQQFIQGTVFEEYIYHLICDHCDFEDVEIGVRVAFDDEVENEFDILMIRNNHLHTIECKLVSGLDGEHYVYKTELIKDYLDDDGRAMILSIGADNVRISKSGRKRVQFTRGDRARADYGKIKVHQRRNFDPEAFLDDVHEWFID